MDGHGSRHGTGRRGRLDVSVAQALVRLRAYAFGRNLLLADVAQDVVARRLRFVGAGDEASEI